MLPLKLGKEARELIAQNHLGQAIQLLQRGCMTYAHSAPLRFELARALGLAGRISEATELYFDLCERGFRQPIVLASLALSLFNEGRVAESIAGCRAVLSVNPDLHSVRSNLLFSLCCQNDDPAVLFEEHRSFASFCPPPIPFTHARRPGKIRVAFLCAWFNNHPVGRFALPVVQSLSRDRFEVYCYFSGAQSDALTEQFRAAADCWRDISEMEDPQADQLLRQDDIDILIELDGHTGGNRLPLIARKPARKVITWLGYPNTTGLSSVDHKIVDPITDPAPLAQSLHTERLLYIDSPFTLFPVPEVSPKVSPLPALTNKYITFGAFGQVHKHSASAISAISRILLSTPHSRLVIRATACSDLEVRKQVVNRFVSQGVSAGRVDCAAATSNEDYFACHHAVDIMLDWFPYNGFTTTCESLWMGVPMVTLQGYSHRERGSSSLITAAGYPNLIAASVDEYVEIATALARDGARLSSMRGGMRETLLASPLMDLPRFVANFENALLSVLPA